MCKLTAVRVQCPAFLFLTELSFCSYVLSLGATQIKLILGGDIQKTSPRPVATLAKAEVSEQAGSEREGEKQSFPSGDP